MVRFTFEVADDTLIDREILRVGMNVTDAQPAFEAIGELLVKETKEQFATEGHHASGGWVRLAASTVESKRKRGARLQILQDTGDLVDSLTEKGDPNMILEARPLELIYGTKVSYARYHQTGTHRMPRRRPLEFTEETKRGALKILQRYVMTGGLA